MPLYLILTTQVILITLVTLITDLLSFFSYNNLSDLYVDKYNPRYPSHKAYLGRWNTNNKFLHDSRDLLNTDGWDSLGKTSQISLNYLDQTLIFSYHQSYIHPGMLSRKTSPISAF